MRHTSDPQWSNPNASDSWKARIMKQAERGDFRLPTGGKSYDQRAAQRSSLIKLAHSAFDLHLVSLAKGVCPRDADDGGSQPLAAALAALKTAARNNRE
jgi:hypothetical protein